MKEKLRANRGRGKGKDFELKMRILNEGSYLIFSGSFIIDANNWFSKEQLLAIGQTKWHIFSMENVITMDQVGRLILPTRIRKALRISAPVAFKAEVMGNKVELTLIAPESSTVVKKRRGLLVVSTGRKKFNAAEAVRTVREGHRDVF